MANPIRILCVFSELNRGGAESMCMNLYRQMDRSRVQFDFVKHGSKIGLFEDEIRAMGGQVYEAPKYRIYNHAAYCKWWIKHLRAHPEHQIVHGHYFTISAIYFKIAHSQGRVTVAHSHSAARATKHWKEQIKAKLRKDIEKYADYCLACSQDAGKWLFPNREFIVLNNAIDTKRFSYCSQDAQEVRKELALGNDFVVGTVGRMIPVKNPMGIVEIFKALSEKKRDVRLLWVGDGQLRAEAEAALAQAGVLERTVFTGVRSDVDRLMQAMDVFILPSLLEGLPLVLVEAQVAGLPCLCSEAVTREVDLTGRCEFLPVNQPELWAARILTAPHDRPDTRGEICRAGYDIETASQWLEHFYLDCLKKK